jgi:two-component system, OmpR family, sensor kinase
VRNAVAAGASLGRRLSNSFDRVPIRMRLAGVSALLTFVILCGFAIAIGSLTVHRIRSDFNRQVADDTEQVANQLRFERDLVHGRLTINPPLEYFATRTDGVVIRLFSLSGNLLVASPHGAPRLGLPNVAQARNVHGYRVVSRRVDVVEDGVLVGRLFLQYGRRVSDTEATVKRVELFLLLGVLGGSALALVAGMAIARRAMKPIATLTSTAAEIARTRDPSRGVPMPQAEDEVAELARTLQGMLRELDAARSETEGMLTRQRRFVADASHELRTPLTSVLANLELLADSLGGEQGEAARSALRSSQRMRRLVADLLLLARSDAARKTPHEPCDLAQVALEAASELGPVSDRHEISLEVHPATVLGARDELHRLAINLIENAIRHTPEGTHVRVSTSLSPDRDQAIFEVADDGPGVPPELAPTLFERFVRGAGDRGGSFGLGLAIVQAVARSHGGEVNLAKPETGTGARFVVTIPTNAELNAPTPQPAQPKPEPLPQGPAEPARRS